MMHFKKIYSVYKHRVYFFVKKYVQRDEDIEDIVQEIFIHIWKHIDQTTHEKSIEAIIFKTSKQEIANFYRKNKRSLPISEKTAREDMPDELSDEDHSDQQISKIEALLNELPHKTKELFIQHTVDHLSYSQLAQENKISKAAIGKHINKALHFLKMNLQ